MPQLHVLRVFCAEYGDFGNALGVFLDGGEVPEDRRKGVASETGSAAPVLVDAAAYVTIRLIIPVLALPFPGSPPRVLNPPFHCN